MAFAVRAHQESRRRESPDLCDLDNSSTSLPSSHLRLPSLSLALLRHLNFPLTLLSEDEGDSWFYLLFGLIIFESADISVRNACNEGDPEQQTPIVFVRLIVTYIKITTLRRNTGRSGVLIWQMVLMWHILGRLASPLWQPIKPFWKTAKYVSESELMQFRWTLQNIAVLEFEIPILYNP